MSLNQDGTTLHGSRLCFEDVFLRIWPLRRLNKAGVIKETLTQMSNVSPAMRSGTGASVVNGRWAVDPPGEYKAGGTTFTYTRPRAQAEGEEERGETLRAAGPTSTQLQLYVSPPPREGYLC